LERQWSFKNSSSYLDPYFRKFSKNAPWREFQIISDKCVRQCIIIMSQNAAGHIQTLSNLSPDSIKLPVLEHALKYKRCHISWYMVGPRDGGFGFDQSKKYSKVDNLDEICVQCQAGQHKKCFAKSRERQSCECEHCIIYDSWASNDTASTECASAGRMASHQRFYNKPS